MKAAVLAARDDIRVEEVDAPKLGERDVLVKVRATGICGSDIPRVLGSAASRYPIVLGHEFSGVVAAAGSRVTRVREGQRVAGIPLLPCGTCFDCLRGNYAQCGNYSFIGSRRNGSWAEYVAVPEDNVLVLDEGMSFEEAAFIEPATVALHALRHIAYQGGEHVLVIGAGTIGLLALQWAKLYGARDITVIDISDERLQLASRLGASHALHGTRDRWLERSLEITQGRGFGVILEAAGVNATIRQAFQLAAAKGKVCLIGTSPTDLTFGHKEFELINRKSFLLTGSWMSYSAPFPGVEWELAKEAIEAGRIQTGPLLFRKMELAQVNEAFDYYRRGGAPGKIMFTFGG